MKDAIKFLLQNVIDTGGHVARAEAKRLLSDVDATTEGETPKGKGKGKNAAKNA